MIYDIIFLPNMIYYILSVTEKSIATRSSLADGRLVDILNY